MLIHAFIEKVNQLYARDYEIFRHHDHQMSEIAEHTLFLAIRFK